MNLIVDVVQAQTLSAAVLGKRSRADDDPKPTLPWLSELHKKIWNKKDLRPNLFRTVKVTLADYAAMQKRLKDLHPDRDLPDYDGNEDQIGVLSVKLDFLRSLPSVSSAKASPTKGSSSRHPDHSDDEDSEADNDDDIILKSLFPSTLSFLDLSPLGLKEKMPGRFILPLLNRKEYKDISELIKKKPQNSGGSVLVSGQPGSGAFLVSLSHRI